MQTERERAGWGGVPLVASCLATVVMAAACSRPVGEADSLLQGDGQGRSASVEEGLYMSVVMDFLPADASDQMVSNYLTLPEVFCQRLKSGAKYEVSEALITKTLVDAGMSLRRSQEWALKLHYAGTRWKCPELIPAGLSDQD